jgi:hypothetical protein
MYYCPRCAEAKGWPQTMTKSYGPCEVCSDLTTCNDLPSKQLQRPEHEPIQELAIINTEK